jgi:hypothetical protein
MSMYLELTPIKLRLSAVVTLKVDLLFKSFRKVLYKHDIWTYKTPTIRKKMVDTIKDEKDNSPPQIDSFIDKVGSRVRCI